MRDKREKDYENKCSHTTRYERVSKRSISGTIESTPTTLDRLRKQENRESIRERRETKRVVEGARQREREREREGEGERVRETEREKKTERKRQRQTDRQRQTETDRDRQRQTEKEEERGG